MSNDTVLTEYGGYIQNMELEILVHLIAEVLDEDIPAQAKVEILVSDEQVDAWLQVKLKESSGGFFLYFPEKPDGIVKMIFLRRKVFVPLVGDVISAINQGQTIIWMKINVTEGE